MGFYYKHHSVNSVQRSYWCSARESSEINSIFCGKCADLLSARLGALSPLSVCEKRVCFYLFDLKVGFNLWGTFQVEWGCSSCITADRLLPDVAYLNGPLFVRKSNLLTQISPALIISSLGLHVRAPFFDREADIATNCCVHITTHSSALL